MELLKAIAVFIGTVGGFCFLLCRYREQVEKAADWFYNLARRGK